MAITSKIEALDDSIAAQTEWTPLKRGGQNFCSHRLKQIDMHKVKFGISIGGIVFGLVFFLFGGGLGGVLTVVLAKTEGLSPALLIPAGIGSILGACGILLTYYMSKPRVFDKQSGLYWKGHKAPNQLYDTTQKNVVELSNIHALQIISEYCSGSDNGSFYSHELNLVLTDASRMNVVDHGNLAKLRQDAKKLSEFLGVPVWDVVKDSKKKNSV